MSSLKEGGKSKDEVLKAYKVSAPNFAHPSKANPSTRGSRAREDLVESQKDPQPGSNSKKAPLRQKTSIYTIGHNRETLLETADKPVTLTLADSSVLEEETVLTNDKLAFEDKSRKQKRMQEDQEEAREARFKILEDSPERVRITGDSLTGEGLIGQEEEEPEEEASLLLRKIEGKLGVQRNDPREGKYDLETRKTIANDYMTEEELGFFNRNQKKKEKKAKRGSWIVKAEKEAKEDLGKRVPKEELSVSRDQEESIDRLKKLAQYSKAMKEASERTKSKTIFKDANQDKNEEDFYQLQMMIKNNQKLAQQKAKKAEEQLAAFMKKETPEEETQEETKQNEESEGVILDLESETKPTDLKSVITKVKAMEADPFKRPEKYLPNNLRKKKFKLSDQASGFASVIDVAMPSERLKQKVLEENEEQEAKDSEVKSQLKEAQGTNKEGEEDEEVSSIESEEDEGTNPLELDQVKDLNRSTFAALEMFRNRGLLKANSNNVIAGRNNDERLHHQSEKLRNEVEEDDGLKLEHRDKDGRLMSKKQAFRYICWAFHNKKPSKIKQAKMAQKLKAQEATEWSNPEDSFANKVLREAQKTTNKPYLNLSDIGKK